MVAYSLILILAALTIGAGDAAAYLSAGKRMPASVEIVRVVGEKRSAPCRAKAAEDRLTSLASAPCVGGPMYCPERFGLAPRRRPAPAKKHAPRSAKKNTLPAERTVVQYSAYDQNGEVRLVITEASPCAPASVVYRGEKDERVTLTPKDPAGLLAALNRFHRGCVMSVSLASAGEITEFSTECRKIPAASGEHPEPAEAAPGVSEAR
jgi:hypothetical protein